MPPRPLRVPALTREIIAATYPGPAADDGHAIPLRSDAELAALLEATLREGGVGEALWLFAYGSLLWKPEVEFAERRMAMVRGWHRRFCLWQWRYRGTKAKPNLMLALDRGGACKGVAYRIDGPGIAGKLAEVWKREMVAYGYVARWLAAETDAGPVKTLAFVANHGGERYAGRLSHELVARHIAEACGHSGPGAEYLCEAVLRLEELGIHDRALWELQALVAARLGAARSR
jgi:glutathione-specific gamma-glutamylcyclotransferase